MVSPEGWIRPAHESPVRVGAGAPGRRPLFVVEGGGHRTRRADRVGEDVLEGLDLFAAELLDPVELLLEFRFGGEIPSHVRDSVIRWSLQSARSEPLCTTGAKSLG